MTGELLKPPHPIEVESYQSNYALEEWDEKMPGYDLTLFFHRLLIERDTLIEALNLAKGLPPGSYPLPAKEIPAAAKETLKKLKSD
jgi:hypothetical protein